MLSVSDSNAMTVPIFLTVAAISMPIGSVNFCKINTKISSNVIILNIFKTNDVGKTHLSTKKKLSKISMSRDQIPLKDRLTLASSFSLSIHLAHPGHAQNGSIRLSQQDDAKISNVHVCTTYAPSPGNYPLKREFSIDTNWKSEYTNIVYWIYLY